MGLSQLLIQWGFTRDSFLWFWSRLTTGALLLVSGLIDLPSYVGVGWSKAITVTCVVILFFAGKYDSSPLPGKKL